jgi:shikimate dehydrogenase
MIKACVIGWPISHSRSPLIHGYWLRQHGIEGIYTKVPVEPRDLPEFISSLAQNGYAGCNVTIPHKEAVFDLVEVEDEQTRRLGAVNTIHLRNGQIVGENTDGIGFFANLMASAPNTGIANQRVAILGAGGSAMAVAAVLLANGVMEIALINRSIERAESVRTRLGPAIKPTSWESRDQALSECSLVVNTTSLGMAGQPALAVDLRSLPQSATVSDIVYVPLMTSFLQDAQARGHPVVTGLGMLLHQAVPGFTRWFGTRPEVTVELHDLVARDIDPDYNA